MVTLVEAINALSNVIIVIIHEQNVNAQMLINTVQKSSKSCRLLACYASSYKCCNVSKLQSPAKVYLGGIDQAGRYMREPPVVVYIVFIWCIVNRQFIHHIVAKSVDSLK